METREQYLERQRVYNQRFRKRDRRGWLNRYARGVRLRS